MDGAEWSRMGEPEWSRIDETVWSRMGEFGINRGYSKKRLMRG